MTKKSESINERFTQTVRALLNSPPKPHVSKKEKPSKVKQEKPAK
jgi:hypothetical protein